MSMGEIPASQQALLALAGDTGGRAVLNTNALDAGIARALEEGTVVVLFPDFGDRYLSTTLWLGWSKLGGP